MNIHFLLVAQFCSGKQPSSVSALSLPPSKKLTSPRGADTNTQGGPEF